MKTVTVKSGAINTLKVVKKLSKSNNIGSRITDLDETSIVVKME
jgi:hypothetical protein